MMNVKHMLHILAGALAFAAPTMTPMPGMTMLPMPGTTSAPATTAPAVPRPSAVSTPSAMPSANLMPMRGPSMRSMTDLADPMSQDGSGTSWIPASTPMFGWMRAAGRDLQMTHGAAFPRYVATGSLRGDRRLDAPNWIMFMGSHALGTGTQLSYTVMFSADALTENQTGYPLLFQSGETAHGIALHDHQHPHDVVSELAVDYSVRVGRKASAYLYLGYPGEPALGPPAFMHRRVAYDMPDAPIGHHWQDATHIQFGVVTMGFAPGARFKFEASAFTGREPDEVRTNFDRPHLDSSSGRISWNPNDRAAGEVSYAFIKSPDATEPLVDQHRLVASLLLNAPLGGDRNWYNGLVFGENLETGGARTRSLLVETDYQTGRNTAFARWERGTRTARDLALPGVLPAPTFPAGALSLGGVHDLNRPAGAAAIGIGAQVTLGAKSAPLNAAYGAGTPFGFQVYLRMRPPAMGSSMENMAGMDGASTSGR